MDRNNAIEQAIKQRRIDSIVQLMFEPGRPKVKPGFNLETEIWDYKKDCPKVGKDAQVAWAEISKDVLAFHNQKGGVIIFGIDDGFSFVGAGTRLDSKLFNDQIRKFLGDKIWVEYHREFIQSDQKYLGVALIPPRGPVLERFVVDGPSIDGRKKFAIGDSSLRVGDSTKLLSKKEADNIVRKIAIQKVGEQYSVNEPMYRIFNPEYHHFVERKKACDDIERSLSNPRTFVTSVIGIGGMGKTALATWAALRAYERKQFDFIVSITAKDRELTPAGIKALDPTLSNYESLLNSILEVTGFPEFKQEAVKQKEAEVLTLLEKANGLLLVDNLETVDDAKIIEFLDNLPQGPRAIVTSRRTAVRFSVFPIDLGPLDETEVFEFVNSLSGLPGFGYINDLNKAEKIRVGSACGGIPLSIRWTLSRSSTAADSLALADSILKNSKHGEELLEFCFRRVFDSMEPNEKLILQALSIFHKPLAIEAIIAGTTAQEYKVTDTLDVLVKDALVTRQFDVEKNDYVYSLLPITRKFVYDQVSRESQLEGKIRSSMSDWFEAKDAKDDGERVVLRELRQGKASAETGILDLALAARRRGDYYSAGTLFDQALSRNAKSWKTCKEYAEFERHVNKNTMRAIQLYEQAAAYAPSRGTDKALIYREWGMLLRNSGDPDATDLAISKFEIALRESPNDVLCIHALADMLARKGSHRKVVNLLEPLSNHVSQKTRDATLPILLKAYQALGEIVKAAELKNKLG